MVGPAGDGGIGGMASCCGGGGSEDCGGGVDLVACVMLDGGARVGYLRGADDAAVRAALELDEPMFRGFAGD